MEKRNFKTSLNSTRIKTLIDGTQIEKILLPSDTSTIKTGTYSTYIVGKENSSLQTTLNATEIAISQLDANDTLKLNRATFTWDADHVAKNVGNNGKGGTQEEINMSGYLKRYFNKFSRRILDTLIETGNDAISNFATTGNNLVITNGKQFNSRILVEISIFLKVITFQILQITTNSLSELIYKLPVDRNDILWLSDGSETVNSGDGNDKIVNGGTDNLVQVMEMILSLFQIIQVI